MRRLRLDRSSHRTIIEQTENRWEMQKMENMGNPTSWKSGVHTHDFRDVTQSAKRISLQPLLHNEKVDGYNHLPFSMPYCETHSVKIS